MVEQFLLGVLENTTEKEHAKQFTVTRIKYINKMNKDLDILLTVMKK